MVPLYTDVHVDFALTRALRLRGVNILTAQDDGAATFSDPDLLDRATELGRVLISQDKDLLRETAAKQQQGRAFAGVIYAIQNKRMLGRYIDDLELIALGSDAAEYASRVHYLPL
jgi:uncharacterized protein with PIN domain